MLKTRIITAVVGVPVILGIIYLGNWYSHAFFFLLGFLGIREMQLMLSAQKIWKPFPLSPFLLFAILFFYPLYNGDGAYPHANLVLYLFLLVLVLEFIAYYPRRSAIDLCLSFFGPVYIGFLLGYTTRIVTDDQSFYILLLAFLIAWSSDIGGYVFGRLWGKNKMTPVISPNKTWEGFAGALVFAIIVCLLFFTVTPGLGLYLPFYYAVVLGIVGSIAAQLGDLLMSGVKRTFQVKDTGGLIPGHGGILDRFDSFLLVVPAVYYFLFYFAEQAAASIGIIG